jgi:uracil-DNA glycosylase family 4
MTRKMTPAPGTGDDKGSAADPGARWKALWLLDDWVSTGFARAHSVPAGEEAPLDDGARGKAAAPAETPTPKAPAAWATAAPRPEQAPADAPAPGAAATRASLLAEVAAAVASCTKCGLCANRTTAVPGEGPMDPGVLFVGEGPGAEEDRTGRPFVGAAGQYLDTWLPPIGLKREQCFIANCVKCRPPQNREPHPDEISACLPYLERQIAIIRPRVICCLGRIAAQTVLGTTVSLGGLRGRVHELPAALARSLGAVVPVVVTYHPSAVLRDKSTLRKPVWDDLKMLKSLLDR